MSKTEALREQFAAMRWFHSIDFGDFASSGRFKPGAPQNITLYGAMDFLRNIDLHGVTVLDIGAADGLASFGMKQLGAKRVAATDSVRRETFERSREVLGLDIEYHPQVQIKDFGRLFDPGTFDVILCAGVIYHMVNPMSAFIECRRIIKEGGLFILETAYAARCEQAAVFLNSEETLVDELYTYSVPTRKAVTGAMKLVGFDPIAVRTIASPDRATVLGRAVQPNDVRDRTPLTVSMHEAGFCDFEMRSNRRGNLPPASGVKYHGPEDDRAIDYLTQEPDFPFHPRRTAETVGTTVWKTADRNR